MAARIPGGVIDAAEAALDALEAPLAPYFRPLSASDRRHKARMGAKPQAFVERAEAYAGANEAFRPGHLDMAAFSAHLETARRLWNLIDKMEQVTSTLKDTLSAEGSDALEAAYIYYNALKLAVRENVAGAEAQLEELGGLMPSKSHKRGGESSESGEAAPAR